MRYTYFFVFLGLTLCSFGQYKNVNKILQEFYDAKGHKILVAAHRGD